MATSFHIFFRCRFVGAQTEPSPENIAQPSMTSDAPPAAATLPTDAPPPSGVLRLHNDYGLLPTSEAGRSRSQAVLSVARLRFEGGLFVLKLLQECGQCGSRVDRVLRACMYVDPEWFSPRLWFNQPRARGRAGS
jgi:hypothetical protein